jgi:hypothetical protein
VLNQFWWNSSPSKNISSFPAIDVSTGGDFLGMVGILEFDLAVSARWLSIGAEAGVGTNSPWVGVDTFWGSFEGRWASIGSHFDSLGGSDKAGNSEFHFVDFV